MKAGTQVCSWGQTGIAYKVLRVGTVETLEANVLEMRLVRLEGVPQAVSGSNLTPGMLLKSVLAGLDAVFVRAERPARPGRPVTRRPARGSHWVTQDV